MLILCVATGWITLPHAGESLYLNLANIHLARAATSLVNDPEQALLELESARAAIAQAEEMNRQDPRLDTARGRVALQEQRPDVAASWFSYAITHGVASNFVYWYLGVSEEQLGNRSAAINAWRQAGAEYFFYQRGLDWRHQKAWSRAESSLQLAVAIAPDNSMLWSAFANFYYEWGKPELARQAWLQALRTESDPYQRLVLEGQVALAEKRTAAAETIFRDAIGRAPTRGEAYDLLADAFVQGGRLRAAIDVLTDGIDYTSAAFAAPSGGTARTFGMLLKLAQLWTQAGQFEKADQLYEQASRLGSRSDEPWLLRGQNALAWGEWGEAETYLRRAIQTYPSNAESHFWLGQLLAQRGHCPEARSEYAAVARLAPDNPAFSDPAPHAATVCP